MNNLVVMNVKGNNPNISIYIGAIMETSGQFKSFGVSRKEALYIAWRMLLGVVGLAK